MSAYMKNNFPFFGIKTPERRLLAAGFVQEHGLPEGKVLKQLCRLCFSAEQRELHYFVNDVLRKRVGSLSIDFLDLFEELIAQKSWWDTVDFIAPYLAGPLLLRFPETMIPYTQRWIESPDFWYHRAAIIFQLDYKEKTNVDLLFEYIERRADSKEFFVQKAGGWALRQYARVNPEAVRAFIETTKLPDLTAREGLKRIG
jgi:3-methyladenine DNA glycosylase AlkD